MTDLSNAELNDVREILPVKAELLALADVAAAVEGRLAGATKTLSDLPAATAIQAGDKLLLRQSGADKVIDGALVATAPYSASSTYPAGSVGANLRAVVEFQQNGTGSVSRTVQAKLRETVSVKDFGAVGDGTTNDTAAIQAAIDYLQNGAGGKLIFPNGAYYITSSLTVGNSAAGIGHNTLAPVSLEGTGPVSGVGYASPSNCAIIKSNVAGPAIKFLGNLGWGLRDFAFTFTTTSTSAAAFACYEVQSGNAENITVLNCPGSVAVDLQTWGNVNLTYNHFRNMFIYMNTSPAGAIGLRLGGPGTGGNVAFNTIEGLHVQPGVSTHIGLSLGFCDTNLFQRYDCNPGASGAIAVQLDYVGGNGFPGANTFVGGDIYDNRIVAVGTSGALVSPNHWYGFPFGNNAPVPTSNGFTVEKQKLAENSNFYVNGATGSATSFGIFAGNPCLNVQQAYDQIAKYFDLNGYTATINVADATYSAGLDAAQVVAGWSGPSSIKIIGGGGSTVFSTGANPCFKARRGCGFELRSLNMTVSSLASLVVADGGQINSGTGTVYGGASVSHKQALSGGVISDTGGNFLTGSPSVSHYDARSGGVINANGQTITLLANVTCTQFAYARGGQINSTGMTFSMGGFALTGSRYKSEVNGVIDTFGAGGSYFPGASAGSTATGGQYV